MEYKYKAIRQKYKGHRYDSKHEARWAKVLNRNGIRFQPHPKWAQSRLWYPDMAVKTPDNRIVLIEIKPTWDFATRQLKEKMMNHRALTRQKVGLAILIDPDDDIIGTFVGRKKIIKELEDIWK